MTAAMSTPQEQRHATAEQELRESRSPSLQSPVSLLAGERRAFCACPRAYTPGAGRGANG